MGPRKPAERYDAGAGLQYLNARYYDPELGLFLQPDWFEVTKAGVGTNRYAYSFNDPVNARDPSGNAAEGGESRWDRLRSWWKRQVEIGRNRRAIAEKLGIDVRRVGYDRTTGYSALGGQVEIFEFGYEAQFAGSSQNALAPAADIVYRRIGVHPSVDNHPVLREAIRSPTVQAAIREIDLRSRTTQVEHGALIYIDAAPGTDTGYGFRVGLIVRGEIDHVRVVKSSAMYGSVLATVHSHTQAQADALRRENNFYEGPSGLDWQFTNDTGIVGLIVNFDGVVYGYGYPGGWEGNK